TEDGQKARKTVLITSPVRTGQQVYAEDGDLIVTGAVSQGAELIADGNIHIYAPMRGRALAGAKGDTSARIFIHSMQAELVSVAGIYR
ncbi:septum site-determining protein MinC, partial [Klebsiella variicola]